MFWIILSAILGILSHPTVIAGFTFPDLSFLAWFAYIPLLGILQNKKPWQQARYSFYFAAVYYFGTLYWLYFAMHGYGNMTPFFSVLVLLILVGILSVYFASIFFVSAFIEKRLLLPRFLVLPIVWIGIELCRNYFPVGGFPWGQIGYTQWKFISLIQIADLTGIYGVSALLVLANVAGFELLRFGFDRLYHPLKIRNRAWIPIFSFLVMFVIVIAYGRFSENKIQAQMAKAPHLRLALIQGNIPQDDKWAVEKSDEIVLIYQDLTRRAIHLGVDLAIWPESAYPFELALDVPAQLEEVGQYPIDLVLGAVTYISDGKVSPNALFAPLGFPIHNSGFLLKAGGELAEVHSKEHLVPYGEYIPLKSMLPFLNKLTSQVGEFEPGKKSVLLNSGQARMGILICYEDIFPELTRRVAKIGANLLVNLTNDAWYENSSALPQHLAFSAFRAIEARLSLVRATNTGITATFNPDGTLRKRLPIFVRDFLVDEVGLHESSTFYTKYGDMFAGFCLGLMGVLFLISCFWRRKNV